jgi:hypothetical protein
LNKAGFASRFTAREGQGDTGNVVDQRIDIRLAHQLTPLLHQAHL